MGSKLFRDHQALSSALAALGSPQPRAFGSLNNLEPLVSMSNYYLETPTRCLSDLETSKLTNEIVQFKLAVF